MGSGTIVLSTKKGMYGVYLEISCTRGKLTVRMKKRLVRILKKCDTKERVENSFARFCVSDYSMKTEYLVAAMGNPELFFSNGSQDVESIYITVLSMFLTAEWKINETYTYKRRFLIGHHRV